MLERRTSRMSQAAPLGDCYQYGSFDAVWVTTCGPSRRLASRNSLNPLSRLASAKPWKEFSLTSHITGQIIIQSRASWAQRAAGVC